MSNLDSPLYEAEIAWLRDRITQLERERDALRQALVTFVGEDNPVELRKMALELDKLPVPNDERLKMKAAIDALAGAEPVTSPSREGGSGQVTAAGSVPAPHGVLGIHESCELCGQPLPAVPPETVPLAGGGALTPTEINAAIAQACGWCFHPRTQAHDSIDEWRLNGVEGELPNYCADLNAMATARATLNYEQRVLFVCTLIGVQQPGFRAYPNTPVGKLGCFGLIDAPATQQAEAFLRTLGLWKEQP